ncbi:MAG: 3',5'-cyclic-nucleotide phosphodiesterase [Polyangiaceae bacterium]|jgi:ribonuclease BN (tRNA processing enzyme)|nr:3',5'-cyclic-nucleotide phosphodiesterase [Polyangiaceae bacterium]
MELHVIGCHGGETPRHRASTFLLDSTLAIDAGAATRGLDLDQQGKLEACLVSHAHLDHVRDLATLADNRCQMRSPPLIVAGCKATIQSLRKHFFNGVLWPDFSVIPCGVPGRSTIEFVELEPEVATVIAGRTVRAIPVSHTIDCSGFVVERGGEAIAYSGDTGPTDRFWQVLDQTPNLRAMLIEVSFPDREAGLARVSGHYTPGSLALDLKKLPRAASTPTFLYHIKPFYQREVETECARLPGLSLEVPQIDDVFQI